MDQALANGNYRTYGFICTAAISYNPVANGGSGPLGQIYCITAVSNVKNQVCLNIVDPDWTTVTTGIPSTNSLMMLLLEQFQVYLAAYIGIYLPKESV